MTKTNTSTALALRPTCPSSPAHGFMAVRPLAVQTKEQQWCGVWYDCSEAHCRSSVLYQSPALIAHHNEAFTRIKRDFEALRGKRQRERFLQASAPWIADALREGRSHLYQ